MTDKKVITLQKERHLIDSQTGETQVIEQEFTRVVNKDKFIQVFLEDMRPLMGIKGKSELRVLMILWQMAEYDSNKLILIKDTKETIAKKAGYTYGGVSNAIAKLVKQKVLLRHNTSVYYINPIYFFKGSNKSRKDCFRVLVEYKLVSSNELSE